MIIDKLPRDLPQAMWRGFRCRCPACGEPFHHHRADDFPAYLVIVIAGHIVVPLILMVETDFHPAYWIHLALWLPLTLGLCLGLLQPVKGAVVALQWFLGMHGFEPAMKQRLALMQPATLEIRQSGV